MSAGRWEQAVLSGADRILNNVAVVMADVTPIPNNSKIVQTLASQGFTVYALGCGSLARINPNKPWWWSPVIGVKDFLAPVTESYVCWDFSNSPLTCDSPKAAEVFFFFFFFFFKFEFF